MSQPPPPYPGNEQKGYPPPPNAAYPPPMQGFGSPPPPGQGYAPPPNYNTGYGQPSAPGYAPYNPPPPQYGGPQATTVVVQPAYTSVVQHFRESPVHTRCPHCQAEIMTATHYETGTLSWIICLILCFVGCSAGCCLIPFCVDGCKDVVHSCPNCRQHISRWGRM
ncbi:hypothetical protein SNE40_005650 [Patella caerulea]|uniref:LITAF domain-containing protein n=1 Tax=Patella caerulea TaxID=87958 RepID=A0AAN8K517_PATCE